LMFKRIGRSCPTCFSIKVHCTSVLSYFCTVFIFYNAFPPSFFRLEMLEKLLLLESSYSSCSCCLVIPLLYIGLAVPLLFFRLSPGTSFRILLVNHVCGLKILECNAVDGHVSTSGLFYPVPYAKGWEMLTM